MDTSLHSDSIGSAQQRKTAITNVRVFNGLRFEEPATVVIDGGLIGREGDVDGAKIIDGEGKFLLPGFIDAHIHLNGVRELQMMAEYGVTTGLDMATWPPSKVNALRGLVGLTDFRTPGVGATSPGSLHSILLPIPRESLVTGPDDAKRFVGDRIAEGVDYIKIIADVPGPDQATMNAISAIAHEHNKLVIIHASAKIPFGMALDAKGDIITHAPVDQAVDDDMCARMLKDNTVSVPTLTMMEAVTKPLSWKAIFAMLLQPFVLLAIIKAKRQTPGNGGARTYEHARESVTALHRAGVPILAGTDCHEEPGSPFSVKHGDSLHREFELLVEAGLSTVEVLQATTALPAKHFRLHDRGVIETGKRADLVLLSEDPIADIRATRSIERVWCGGIEVNRS